VEGTAEQDKEQQDSEAVLAQTVLLGRKEQWEGANIEELCVRDEVEDVELLYVKIKCGAIGGAALRPRRGGCFTLDRPNNLDWMMSWLECREDLRWMVAAWEDKVN
jgi:hypothetical protein